MLDRRADGRSCRCRRRQSRLIIYTANYRAMNGLMAYLTENCCGGASCMPDLACCPTPNAEQTA